MNLTVDAHFAQLVLSVEARTLLVDLHQTVESQVRTLFFIHIPSFWNFTVWHFAQEMMLDLIVAGYP